MTLKEFLETYCDGDISIDVTDSWMSDQATYSYKGVVKNILKYTALYEDILIRTVKAIDVGFDKDTDDLYLFIRAE